MEWRTWLRENSCTETSPLETAWSTVNAASKSLILAFPAFSPTNATTTGEEPLTPLNFFDDSFHSRAQSTIELPLKWMAPESIKYNYYK